MAVSMKFRPDLNKGNLGQPDPLELWADIIGRIPDSKLLQPGVKILCVAAGQGTEAVVLAKRMMALGLDKEKINDAITLIDNNVVFTNYLKLMYGFKNVITEDFLTWEPGMRFDVLVGNPPFQNSDHGAKRWPLWQQFVRKSFEIADQVALVVPQSLTSPGDLYTEISGNIHTLNVDVAKHFPGVGSTFCYFVADTKKVFDTAEVITADKTYNLSLKDTPFLPLTVNDITLKQMSDLLSRPQRTWKRGELHTVNKHQFTENGKYDVMHTNAQWLKSDINHANLNLIRVSISLSGYPKCEVIHNKLLTQNCFWTEFGTLAEAQAFADQVNSAGIQSLLNTFKWSGWNSKEVISYL